VLDGRDDAGRLELATWSGKTGARCRGVRLGEGPLGRAIELGAAYVERGGAESWAAEAGVKACLPLRIDGRVTGAVVVFEWLAHKRQLDPLDHELFALLATHAAVALHASRACAPVAPRRRA
jgi:GAF domain